MRPIHVVTMCFFLSALGLIFFSCSLSPTGNPFDKKNTIITLSGKNSLQQLKNDLLEDSVGNTVSIGFNSNFPYYLDSVQLWIVTESKDTVLKHFLHLTSMQQTDTAWYSISFSDTGTKTIYGLGYINGYSPTISDTITIKIVGKPLNHQPVLRISGQTTLSPGQVCLLTVTAIDTDLTQKDMVTLWKYPAGARLNDSTFTWTPPQGFLGTDSALFIASDNGYPVMYDTAKVLITVTSSSVNRAPKWQLDTIHEPGRPGLPIAITLSDKCTDPDGDPLSFSLISGTPNGGDALSNATYAFTPKPSDTGTYYSRIIASDSKGAYDTVTIAFSIHASNSIDTLAPIMTLLSPSENASVSSNALSIKIVCSDPSGVASVKCSMGTDTFAVSQSDSIYTATVSGLKEGVLNSISFIAIDASSRANTDTLYVHIKYDSTITDNVAPLITLVSPSKDTVIGSDSSVVQVKCTDASGIASVVYSLGTKTFTANKSSTGDVYSATVNGLAAGAYSTVTVTATDASTAHNAATALVKIKYDNDKTPPTLRLFSPALDSTSVSGNAVAIQVVCKDPSGVASLTCNLGASSFPTMKSSIVDSIWSVNITGLPSGAFSAITFVATDSSLAANKSTIIVHVKYEAPATDTLGPVFTKVSGPASGTTITGPIVTLAYTIADPSGVDSVYWTLNGVKAGTLVADASGQYTLKDTLTATGLNHLIIYAQDKSTKRNKSSENIDLTYDPTATDVTGPTITKVSGPANGSRTANPNDTLVYTVSDPSGVDTVSWTLNGTAQGVLTAEANGHYTIKALLGAPHKNTIVVTASDKSANHNKSSETVIIDYNRPPVISGAHDTTIQELATIQFTVTATDPESDKVTIATASTLPTGASFDATTGIFKWTVAAGQKGTSVTFKANDGLDTTIKTISIVVSNMPPPVITKDPVSDTLCLGTAASFSVTATGTGLTYQWKNATANLTEGHYVGTKASKLTIDTVAAGDANTYTCVVTNAAGSVASSAGAKLMVNTTSTIAANVSASAASVCSGGSSTLTETGGTLGANAVWKWYTDTTTAALSTTGASISVSPTATTTYYIRAEGACGNTAFKNVTVSVNTKPTVPTGTASYSACAGTAVTLSATAPAGTTLGWYSNATCTTPLASPSVSPTQTTTYYVRAERGTGKETCNVSDALAITVNINTKPTTPTGTAAYSACAGTAVTLSATAPSGTTLGWYTNAACTTPLASPTVSPTQTTTYYVRAERGTGKETCNVSDALAIIVTVNTKPIAPTGTAAYSSCAGTAVTLSATPPSGTTLGWYSDAACATPLSSPNVSPAQTTTYYVRAERGTGKETCNVSDALAITVNVNTKPIAPTGTAAYAACAGTAVALSATAPSGTTLGWYTNAACTTPLASPSVSPAQTTTYYVRAERGTGKETCNVSDALAITVTIITKPTAPTGTAAYSTCAGTPVTLTATAPSGTTLGWYTNAACTTPLASPVVSPSQQTTYYVRAERGTGKETCNVSDALAITVSINKSPTVSVPSSLSICAGSTANLSVTVSGGTAQSYQWYELVSGSPIAVGTNSSTISIAPPVQTGLQSQSNLYYCVVTDACGKQITSSNTNVTVNFIPDAPPNIYFNFNTDGTQLWCVMSQQNPSGFYCISYRYKKDNADWTLWTNTTGSSQCDNVVTYMGNASPANAIQFEAKIIDNRTNCSSAVAAQTWTAQ